MPLNKQRGNMYDWVTHTWNPLAGECYHKCTYCYVEGMKHRPVIQAKYSGEPRLVEHEMKTNLGSGNKIFVGSMTDMFAGNVKMQDIIAILKHCAKYPDNTYMFQSKNPENIRIFQSFIPSGSIIGTTMETDMNTVSNAPHIGHRAHSLYLLSRNYKTFVTIEPILHFSPLLLHWIKKANPAWVNIGADSQGHNLLEPSWEKVQSLIGELKKFTIVKQKNNLVRLKD